MVAAEFKEQLDKTPVVKGVPILAAVLQNADVETLRQMCDRFRQKFTSGVVVLGSAPEGRPVLIAAVTDDDSPAKSNPNAKTVAEARPKIGSSVMVTCGSSFTTMPFL